MHLEGTDTEWPRGMDVWGGGAAGATALLLCVVATANSCCGMVFPRPTLSLQFFKMVLWPFSPSLQSSCGVWGNGAVADSPSHFCLHRHCLLVHNASKHIVHFPAQHTFLPQLVSSSNVWSTRSCHTRRLNLVLPGVPFNPS